MRFFSCLVIVALFKDLDQPVLQQIDIESCTNNQKNIQFNL